VINVLENFFPSPEIVLQLKPEEVVIPLLKCLIHLEQARQDNDLVRDNFISIVSHEGFGGERSVEVAKTITEAWLWLEREIMIAPRPEPGAGRIVYVTERGKKLAEQPDIGIYAKSNLIPRGVIDPRLANKIQSLFIRGDYDTAIFQAFKEVEIRVRTAANLPNEILGTDLMRKAFNPDKGKLINYNQHPSERQALSDLFAGAIGLFKNPSSHRDVNWADPLECVELIYLANHLLRIVERRMDIAQETTPNPQQ
jgi:uncharacterized protein (TIGR02391 family)